MHLCRVASEAGIRPAHEMLPARRLLHAGLLCALRSRDHGPEERIEAARKLLPLAGVSRAGQRTCKVLNKLCSAAVVWSIEQSRPEAVRCRWPCMHGNASLSSNFASPACASGQDIMACMGACASQCMQPLDSRLQDLGKKAFDNRDMFLCMFSTR